MKSLKTFIYEASLAGSTTNYQRPTGAFYKYVQNAKDPDMDFEADRDAKLYDLGQNVVGEDYASELKIVKYIDGKSTTKTIERIQKV